MKYEIVDTTGIECYTPEDIQRILSISKAQAYRLFNSSIPGEEFPSFKLGSSWRISKKDFDKWYSQKRNSKN